MLPTQSERDKTVPGAIKNQYQIDESHTQCL